jgi:hypothetical protein
MARYYFGASNPIGRHFTFEGQARPLEIVGVVADAKYLDLHETPPRTAYENALQGGAFTKPTFLLRTDVPPLSVVPDVRRAVDAVLPNVPLSVQLPHPCSVTARRVWRPLRVGSCGFGWNWQTHKLEGLAIARS